MAKPESPGAAGSAAANSSNANNNSGNGNNSAPASAGAAIGAGSGSGTSGSGCISGSQTTTEREQVRFECAYLSLNKMEVLILYLISTTLSNFPPLYSLFIREVFSLPFRYISG